MPGSIPASAPAEAHLLAAGSGGRRPVFRRAGMAAGLVLTGFVVLVAALADHIAGNPFHTSRIVLRHVVPNVAPAALVVIALTGSRVVLLEAGLAYLGLSNPSVPSWGALINNAQPYLQTAWWMSVFPGGAIALTVFGMNLLSDGLSRSLGPADPVPAQRRAAS